MAFSLSKLTKTFDTFPPAAPAEVLAAETHFNYSFPADYKEFLSLTNGLEGKADSGYLVLWSVKELIELNTAYHVQEFIADIIIFGSDGAEDAFCFDTSGDRISIVRMPFIGMGHIANDKLADSFEEFLSLKLENGNFIKRLFG